MPACIVPYPKLQPSPVNSLYVKTVVSDSKKTITDADFYRIQRAAKRGSINAQYQLANKYHLGMGLIKDDSKSFYWFNRAANQGHTAAQGKLAYMFERGFGVPKNMLEALKWYTQAAKKNDPLALHNLAYLYRHGIGVIKDYKQALTLYHRASALGVGPSANSIGDLYVTGSGVNKDYKQAFSWYKKAADRGFPLAFERLGDLYRYGNGVEKNMGESLQYYQIAAKLGLESAIHKTNRIADENLKQKLLANLHKNNPNKVNTEKTKSGNTGLKSHSQIEKNRNAQNHTKAKNVTDNVLNVTPSTPPFRSNPPIVNSEHGVIHQLNRNSDKKTSHNAATKSTKRFVNSDGILCFINDTSDQKLPDLKALDKEALTSNSEQELLAKIEAYCSHSNIGFKQSNQDACSATTSTSRHCKMQITKRYSKTFEQLINSPRTSKPALINPNNAFQRALNSLNIPQGKQIIWYGDGDFVSQSKIPQEEAYFNINQTVESSLQGKSELPAQSELSTQDAGEKRIDLAKQILPNVFGNPYIDAVSFDAEKKQFNVTVASDSVDYKLRGSLPATAANTNDEQSYILNSSPWVVYEIKDNSIDLKGLFLRTHYSDRLYTPTLAPESNVSVPYGKLAYQDITSKRIQKNMEKQHENLLLNQKMKTLVCKELETQVDLESKKAYAEFCN